MTLVRRLRAIRACALAVLALGHCIQLRAQVPHVTLFDLSTSPGLIERADRAYWNGDASRSIDLLEGALASAPEDVEALWRATRASVALGLLAPNWSLEEGWYRKGIAFSDEALRLDPTHTEAKRWSVAAKGQIAVSASPGETARLAQEIWDATHDLLARDPNDGFAHYALGVLHYEVMKLSRFKRFLARTFFGNDALSQASWEDAIYHHERAISVQPEAIAYRVAFAETLMRRDRIPEAIEHLRRAVSLPILHPGDPDFTALANRYLIELGADGND